MFSYGPLHMDEPVLADQQELSYNSSLWIQDVVSKTSLEQWMIGIDWEKESGKSVLAAWLDDSILSIYRCLCDMQDTAGKAGMSS